MALSKEARQELLGYARSRVESGTSRRKLDIQLRDYSERKYGIRVAIGKETYHNLYIERVEAVKRGLEAQERGYKLGKYREGRQYRYDWLRYRHFTHDEAERLSSARLRLEGNKGLARMVALRSWQFDQFSRMATQKGWSTGKQITEWRAKLGRWYRANGHVTYWPHKGKFRPSVWMWYKAEQRKLPPEDQEGPYPERKRRQRSVSKHKVRLSKEANELKAAIASSTFSQRNKQRFRQRLERVELELGRL